MNVTTQRMPKVEIIPASILPNALSKRKKLIRMKKYTYKHSLNEKYCACERC